MDYSERGQWQSPDRIYLLGQIAPVVTSLLYQAMLGDSMGRQPSGEMLRRVNAMIGLTTSDITDAVLKYDQEPGEWGYDS